VEWKTVLWLAGLAALVAGLAWAVVLLWPLVSSIGDGDAAATEAALARVKGAAGIAAGALVVVGTVLLVAGEGVRKRPPE
jgi:hypothetical protein